MIPISEFYFWVWAEKYFIHSFSQPVIIYWTLNMGPWRRKWQPTPVFFAWEIPWTEEPGGLQYTVSKNWTRISD